MNKPTVLCVIEGFGISTSWKGNAIASSNPKNFYSLWHEYHHNLLFPPKSQNLYAFENKETYIASLLCGVSEKSDKEIIDEEVNSGRINTNKVIQDSFDQIVKSNSALHLIGNLSDSKGEFGDSLHLISLVRLAKQKNIFRIYIHLIIDDSNGRSFDQVSSDILNLNRQLEIVGAGEIASICGMKFVVDWNGSRLGYLNFTKSLKAIVEGRGNVYLSAEQAIAQNRSKLSSPNKIPPSVIAFKNRPVGIMHDLDSIIFFNHNNSKLSNLISSFNTSSSDKINFSIPKFLNTTTFLDYSLPKNKQVNIAITRGQGQSLPSILAEQCIKQIYLSDSFGSMGVKSLLERIQTEAKRPDQLFIPALRIAEYCDNPKPVLTEIFKSALNSINKEYQFIFVDVPAIDVISDMGNFNQTINAVKIIDSYLPLLVKKVLEMDGNLIITSNYGNAEKMVHRDDYELLNKRTHNPIPFILVSRESKNKEQKTSLENEIIYDIIRKKNSLLDIAPTVLGLMNLPIPSEMTGKCLVERRISDKKEA